MLGHEGAHENSKEEDDKKEFKEIQRMVKLMYEAFMAKEVGEEYSNNKKEEERSSKASGGKPPPSPPPPSSSSSSSASSSSKSTTKIHTQTHSKIPKGKTMLLKLDIKF